MKLSYVILIVVIIIVAVGFFSKPSNEFCVEKAKENIAAFNGSVPGYNNPLNPESRSGSDMRPDQIMILDRFLWKEVRFASSSNVRLVGYAYLNKFHKVSEKNAD